MRPSESLERCEATREIEPARPRHHEQPLWVLSFSWHSPSLPSQHAAPRSAALRMLTGDRQRNTEWRPSTTELCSTHGDGPSQCDIHGARDVSVYESGGTYFMHYDAAGPKGWLAAGHKQGFDSLAKEGAGLGTGQGRRRGRGLGVVWHHLLRRPYLEHVLPGYASHLASPGLGACLSLLDDEGQERQGLPGPGPSKRR